MRRRNLVCLTFAVAGALTLGGATPALAIDVLVSVPDTPTAPSPSGYVDLSRKPEVSFDAIAVSGLLRRGVECGSCAPGVGGPIGPVPVGPVGDEARAIVNTQIARAVATYAAVGDKINRTCGQCAPGVGGPIGPVPVGPVGDEARAIVNAQIARANRTYAGVGDQINRTCGQCAPGVGGPIGPVPVGPVGDEEAPIS